MKTLIKKICFTCKMEKSIAEFRLFKGSIDGYNAECKTCRDKRRVLTNSYYRYNKIQVRPTLKDIGRKVIYKPGREEGTITSFNIRYVFVRYGADTNSKATKRSDLEWTNA